MLYYMCEQSGMAPTRLQLEHAIKRNFGGLESDDCNPFVEFMNQIPRSEESTSELVCLMKYRNFPLLGGPPISAHSLLGGGLAIAKMT